MFSQKETVDSTRLCQQRASDLIFPELRIDPKTRRRGEKNNKEVLQKGFNKTEETTPAKEKMGLFLPWKCAVIGCSLANTLIELKQP